MPPQASKHTQTRMHNGFFAVARWDACRTLKQNDACGASTAQEIGGTPFTSRRRPDAKDRDRRLPDCVDLAKKRIWGAVRECSFAHNDPKSDSSSGANFRSWREAEDRTSLVIPAAAHDQDDRHGECHFENRHMLTRISPSKQSPANYSPRRKCEKNSHDISVG